MSNWEQDWDAARQLLSELPEAWADTSAAATHEPVVRKLGKTLATEARARAMADGAVPIDRIDPATAALRSELDRIDRAVAAVFEPLEAEAARACFDVAVDELGDGDRVVAAAAAYDPDPSRGPIAASCAALLNRRRDIYAELLDRSVHRHQAAKAWLRTYRTEVLSLLCACRDMGSPPTAFLVAAGSDRASVDALETASDWTPQDWIKAINNDGEWLVLAATGRAWLDPGRRHLGISTCTNLADNNPLLSGAVHQIGHLAQEVLPHLRSLSGEFYRRRTSIDGHSVEPRLLSAISPAYSRAELWRDGGFAHPFIGAGKQAPTHHQDRLQVLAVGIQGLWCGWPDLSVDRDHQHFVLGALSAA